MVSGGNGRFGLTLVGLILALSGCDGGSSQLTDCREAAHRCSPGFQCAESTVDGWGCIAVPDGAAAEGRDASGRGDGTHGSDGDALPVDAAIRGELAGRAPDGMVRAFDAGGPPDGFSTRDSMGQRDGGNRDLGPRDGAAVADSSDGGAQDASQNGPPDAAIDASAALGPVFRSISSGNNYACGIHS